MDIKDIVSESAKRTVFLLDETGPHTANVVMVPQGWASDFTIANGFVSGPDATPDNSDDGPEIYCWAATHDKPNSPIETLWVSVAYLNMLPEISEREAREIHPAMFEHFAAMEAE